MNIHGVPNATSAEIVRTCYDILDVSVIGNITDYTDGKYDGHDDRNYWDAQNCQAQWLLDQVQVRKGSRMLDIGCGYGRIVQTALERGAEARGITLSPEQQRRCERKNLQVDVLNYKNIPESWNGTFDAVIANGSLEHFVQVQDAVAGRQNQIYEHFFATCSRILKPGGFLATTAIHFRDALDPKEIQKGSRAFPRKSPNAHFAKVLLENLGGWYPLGDQLEQCAKDFTHEYREEATHDYHLTSEFWLSAIKKTLLTKPQVYFAIAGKFLKNPRAAYGMLDTWFFSQSWMWQFRLDKNGIAPTILYRDIWKRRN